MFTQKSRRAPNFSGAMPADVRCVSCASEDVKLVSLYGAHPSEMLMKCSTCKTHFGWFKFRAQSSYQQKSSPKE